MWLKALTYTVEKTVGGQTYVTTKQASGASAALFFIVWLVIMGLAIWGLIGFYKLAKKMNHPHPWWVVVPVLNAILLFQLADITPWILVLSIIPFVNIVVLLAYIYAFYKITEKNGKDPIIGVLIAIFLSFYWPYYVLKGKKA